MPQADNVTSIFDPAKVTHYAISEDAEFKLRQIADGTEAIGMMLEGLDAERVEVPEEMVANIFHIIAFAINGAIRDRAVVYPGKRR